MALQTSVLSYLETMAQMADQSPQHPALRIITPAPNLIYLATFLSPTIFSLSSLSTVLWTYKDAFERFIATQHLPEIAPPYPRPYINEYNGFIMDVCNLLWRSRAFNTTDQNALGCLLPPDVFNALRLYAESLEPKYSLTGLFSLSFHSALAGLSIAAFRGIEDRAIEVEDVMDIDGEWPAGVKERHPGPVTQRSLTVLARNGGVNVSWMTYRMEVLRFLEGMGASGLLALIRRSIKLPLDAESQGRI